MKILKTAAFLAVFVLLFSACLTSDSILSIAADESSFSYKIRKNRVTREMVTAFKESIEKGPDEYPDDYGGLYLDEHQIVTINLVSGKPRTIDFSIFEGHEVNYREVKFSLNELEHTTNTISNDIAVLGFITSLSLHVTENRVEIGCLTPDFVTKTAQYLTEYYPELDQSMIVYRVHGRLTELKNAPG